MSNSRGWLESEQEYSARVAREADEQTIERLSGSSPSRGWIESSDEYRERISREAKEHVIESYTGSSSSKGILESRDEYSSRIEREANEAIVSSSSGRSPSRGWIESSDEYSVRVRREANESIVRHNTGREPSRGWIEGQHEYRSRVAHEAREVISKWKPAKPKLRDSNYDKDYDYISDSGSLQELRTWEKNVVSRLPNEEHRHQAIVDAVVLLSDVQLDEALMASADRAVRHNKEKTTFDKAVSLCIVSRKEKNLFELIKASKLGDSLIAPLFRHRVNEHRGKSSETDFVIDYLLSKNHAYLHFLGESCMAEAKKQYSRDLQAVEEERKRQAEVLAAEPGIVKILRWFFPSSQ